MQYPPASTTHLEYRVFGPKRMRAGVAIASGPQATIDILVALTDRERSSDGQWVTSLLLQAQNALLEFETANYLTARIVSQHAGDNHLPLGGAHGYRTALQPTRYRDIHKRPCHFDEDLSRRSW